jgi:hypothetical protein
MAADIQILPVDPDRWVRRTGRVYFERSGYFDRPDATGDR